MSNINCDMKYQLRYRISARISNISCDIEYQLRYRISVAISNISWDIEYQLGYRISVLAISNKSWHIAWGDIELTTAYTYVRTSTHIPCSSWLQPMATPHSAISKPLLITVLIQILSPTPTRSLALGQNTPWVYISLGLPPSRPHLVFISHPPPPHRHHNANLFLRDVKMSAFMNNGNDEQNFEPTISAHFSIVMMNL